MTTDQAPADAAELQREIERLRAQLAATTEEAERYRKAAYALLRERVPYTSPTEAELKDMLDGPRGRSFGELLDELERPFVVR